MSKRSPDEIIEQYIGPKTYRMRVFKQKEVIDRDGQGVSTHEVVSYGSTKQYDEFCRFYRDAFVLYSSELGQGKGSSFFMNMAQLVDPDTNCISTTDLKKMQFLDAACGTSEKMRRNLISMLVKKGFLRRVKLGVIQVNPHFCWKGKEELRRLEIAKNWQCEYYCEMGMPDGIAKKPSNPNDAPRNHTYVQKEKKKQQAIKPNHEF